MPFSKDQVYCFLDYETYSEADIKKVGAYEYAAHPSTDILCAAFAVGIKNPSYLDIGAHDPETISNTKLLYDRGSRGVNVDASEANIAKFKFARPGDINLCYGVTPNLEKQKVTLYKYSDTSGRNTLDPNEVEKLKGLMTVRETVEVEAVTINMLVNQCFAGKWPNLLSVDIEGLDFDVLSSADFSKSSPDLIVVETRPNDSKRMAEMLEEKGFFLYCRMGENLFFVNFHHVDTVYNGVN